MVLFIILFDLSDIFDLLKLLNMHLLICLTLNIFLQKKIVSPEISFSDYT